MKQASDTCYFMADMIFRTNRLRDQWMGGGLISDPAWDLLLFLFMAEHKGETPSFQEACGILAVPQQTLRRYVTALEMRGLVVFSAFVDENGDQPMRLCDAGTSMMMRVLNGAGESQYWPHGFLPLSPGHS